MMVEPISQCLSDFRIDQWLAGEVDAGSVTALEAHAGRCATCAARIQALTASRDRFAAAPVPPALAAAFAQRAVARPAETRPQLSVIQGGRDDDAREPAPGTRPAAELVLAGGREPARSSRRIALAVAPALAAAAAVLLWLRATPPTPGTDAPPSQPSQRSGAGADSAGPGSERVKGSAHIAVFVVRNGVARAAAPGEIVHPGDALQITYTAAAPGHLAILSRDGAGVGSIYFDDAGRAAAIAPGQDVSLPHSIVLDDTLGRETLYALFCARAVELEPLRQSLERAPLTPPEGCRAEALALEKRVP
jgi:hypothetical protein